jgi:hypothetical protein
MRDQAKVSSYCGLDPFFLRVSRISGVGPNYVLSTCNTPYAKKIPLFLVPCTIYIYIFFVPNSDLRRFPMLPPVYFLSEKKEKGLQTCYEPVVSNR